MPRKKEEQEEGAPAWMVTYGDMVTLLLCFFVLLFSMSEIKKDKIAKTMRAFQAHFGVLPKYKSTVQVFVQPQRMQETDAFVLRRGPPGRHTEVQIISEAERIKRVLGGKELFEEDSAELLPLGQQRLRQEVAPDIRGFKNRIEVRGHTAKARYGPESRYRDAWQLGYLRAHAVMRYLVDECGIDERRFRVVSCGDNEPQGKNLTAKGREKNRRVEIIMTEDLMRGLGGEADLLR